jgi:hypothetical protein
MNLYNLEGRPITENVPDVFLVRPSRSGSESRYTRCDIGLLISRDFTRVFLGGGEWGFESLAREIDTTAIEALAERLNSPELKQVLEKIKASRRRA